MAAAVVGRGIAIPAWRTQRGRPGVEDDRFDFAFERKTPSTTSEFIELELTDGWQQVSPRLRQQETVVRQSGTGGTCARRMAGSRSVWGMVIAILTVLSGVPFGISISDDCSQQKETDENAAERRQMKRARTPCRISKIRTTAWNPDGTGVIWQKRETCRRWWNWCGLRAQKLQVLLVIRQRGQSCLCENFANDC